jgi:predicted XRE-type DNA-binding protein
MATVKRSKSTGNVFRDLGFASPQAENLIVRSELMGKLQAALARRGLKQAEAATLLGVTQPRISDIVRGRIDRFSVDALINMLAALDLRTTLDVRPRPPARPRRRTVVRARRAA